MTKNPNRIYDPCSSHEKIAGGVPDRRLTNQGQYQANLLPNSSFHILRDKGHMLLLDEWKNVLVELIK
jgi:hypothetical protein